MNQEEEEAEEGGRRPNFLCFSWSSSPERYYSSFSPGERLKIKFLNGRSTSWRWSFGAKEEGGRRLRRGLLSHLSHSEVKVKSCFFPCLVSFGT